MHFVHTSEYLHIALPLCCCFRPPPPQYSPVVLNKNVNVEKPGFVLHRSLYNASRNGLIDARPRRKAGGCDPVAVWTRSGSGRAGSTLGDREMIDGESLARSLGELFQQQATVSTSGERSYNVLRTKYQSEYFYHISMLGV